MSFSFSLLCNFLILHAHSENYLNLTYGTLKFGDNPADEAVAFESLEEFHLFIESNNLNPDINEPGYLIKLIEANKNKYAACLDGSPQAFYLRPGYGDGVHKFVLYLQGGGWCAGIDSFVSHSCGPCESRAKNSDRGTSTTDPPYLYFTLGYMSNQYAVNPLSYNWNTVYIRYCDGSSFSGYNSTKQKSADGTQLYFTGFNNLNAVLDKLRDDYGLLNATDVLLTGSSAGGLATWIHTDYIADYIGVKENNIHFLSIPDSGFFMDYEAAGEFDTCMKWIFEFHNTSIVLNKECVNNNEDNVYKCMFAEYMAPYIQHRMMVLQSRFDSWQIEEELRSTNDTLINEYGNNLTLVIFDTYINDGKYTENHLLFLDSCYHHTDNWTAIVVDGYNSSQVQVDWWFNNMTHSKVFFQNMTYPCSSCCQN